VRAADFKDGLLGLLKDILRRMPDLLILLGAMFALFMMMIIALWQMA